LQRRTPLLNNIHNQTNRQDIKITGTATLFMSFLILFPQAGDLKKKRRSRKEVEQKHIKRINKASKKNRKRKKKTKYSEVATSKK
jgi:hypothetical protein